MKRWVSRVIVCSLLLGLLAGCRSYGPDRIPGDRFDYNAAISDSWHTQTLLAIVKLRYSEWPVFLDIEQIVAQYTFENTGTAKGLFRISQYEQAEVGWVGKYSERPVIMYKPLKGERYMRSMLTPLPLGVLLGLIQTGWPADRMSGIFIHSAGGFRNTQVERGLELRPQRAFENFLETLVAFQKKDALIVEVVAEKKDKESTKVVTRLGFQTNRVDAAACAKLASMREKMSLSSDTNIYEVVWGAMSPNANTIALESRSVLQLMVVLAAHVEVSQKDIDEGRISPLLPRPKYERTQLVPLMAVKRGKKAPVDAFASCSYRGEAFWIADTDVNSKITFSYLTLFLTLGDTDKDAGAQMVITTN